MDVLRDHVLPKLRGVRKSGGGFSARCPAHNDRNNSLSIEPGSERAVVIFCHAKCDLDKICTAAGIDKELINLRPGQEDTAWRRIDPNQYYDYTDEDGNLLYQVVRRPGKKFSQRRPDPNAKDGWAWSLGDTRRVLYRLPRVLAAVAECREVYICEGEKDVHTLEDQGLVATCNQGGVGMGWRPEYSQVLREAVVTIIADNDDAGRAHARRIRDSLTGIAASITIAEAAAGKDATDHFIAGKSLDDLVVTWTFEQAAKVELALDLWEFLDAADSPHDWVIPGLLERGDRLILTGFEGLGKSMLIRQIAVCAAAGLHPFDTGYSNRYPARKVLFIDCENSEAQSRRKLRSIAMVTKYLDSPVPTGGMRLIHRPEGIDLTTIDDAAWLIERVTAHKPDILVIGPFYRLHAGNMNDEQIARRTVAVLDAARAVNNCALITEAHAGHGEPGKTRSVRPTGSSLLLRWPEFGYGLKDNPLCATEIRGIPTQVDLAPWRGPRDEREWPQNLQWGRPDELPWQPWKPPRPHKAGQP